MASPTATIAASLPAGAGPQSGPAPSAARVVCFHCGSPCPANPPRQAEKAFCCTGCRTVFEILTENGLGHFYDLGPQAGVRLSRPTPRERFKYLDEPAVRRQMLDFEDARTAKVTFRVPAVHCIACVWLLENLFRLKPGIGRSTVNFPKRECAITFDPARVQLSEVAALLSALGYEPALNLASLDARPSDPALRRLWLRLGVAGFAFGNVMLVSIPSYFGLDAPGLRAFFGWLSIALAAPVLVFSASDYWRAAWLAARRRVLTIDLPIAIGLVALFGQSVFEIATGRGEGYLDSLTGLIFFLLCGKVFQHKTYDRLAFDRDYKSFFPLAVVRRTAAGGEETAPLSSLRVGDRLVLRHGELVPADARLLGGRGLIDYSFVTGEAEPVPKGVGDHLYAGGQQLGAAIEVETVKPVSQSYLTSLWAHEAFDKERRDTLDNLTNRFSRRFTVTVAAVAVGAAAWWGAAGEPARAMKAFVSVLIVACPCALALAAPFALGTAQRLLARRNIFLKHPHVTETLAQVDAVVFDKTGTLTAASAGGVEFAGAPLTPRERAQVRELARHSTHPLAVRIAETLGTGGEEAVGPAEQFTERPGAGIEGTVGGERVCLGSAAWLAARGVALPAEPPREGTTAKVAIGGVYRGTFRLASVLRPDAAAMLRRLGRGHDLALLSGDNARERERFRALFGERAQLHFNQSPWNKLGFIRELQAAAKTVMMVGDGLNDAGALKQSDVGVAVVEKVGAFSPASDVILEAARVPRLPAVLTLARRTVRVVWLSLALSSVYNVVGVSIAASGRLAPVICAILMPLSSVTVVGFACLATQWAARRSGLGPETGPAER